MTPRTFDDGISRFDQGLLWDSMVSSPTRKDQQRMRKAKLNLRAQSDNAFSASTTGAFNALVLNAGTFPALASATTSLGTKLTTFKADLQAVVDARTALQALVAAKGNSRAEVEAVLRVIAGGVDAVALGNVEIIHLAGLLASNEPV